MNLQFAPFFDRPTYQLPELACLNMYVEKTPLGMTFLPRPALVRRNTGGATAGPIRGIYRSSGVASENVFFVSGNSLYDRGNLIGTVAGYDPVRWAASVEQLVVVGGGKAYTYDTTSHAFAVIDDPDLPEVDDVAYLAGRFYFKQKDSDQFWFSALLDARDISGLAFETADASPDATIGMMTLGGQMVFLGQSSIQYFSSTGDDAAPLASAVGQAFDYGCASRDSVVNMDNALFFVGSSNIVYRTNGGIPLRISTHGVEERVRKCADPSQITAYMQFVDGHQFYIVNLPLQGTFAFDVETQRWTEWRSYGEPQLRISCGIMFNEESWLGDYKTGQIWRFEQGSYQDYTDPIEHMVTAFTPLEGGAARCDVVALQCVRGVGTGGQNTDPQVEMSYSDDTGHDWTPWQPRSLGKLGERGVKAVWRRLRMMRSPFRVFRFRSTDHVLFVAEGMTVGDQRP